MRTRVAKSLGAAAAFVVLLGGLRDARAQQVDTNPPAPNVMIMLDNSGSMERMIDNTLPEDNPNNACACDPAGTDFVNPCGNWPARPPNRWGVLVQALTGKFTNGYYCVAMPRTSGRLLTEEYQIGGVNPYDADYYLSYHRPVARDTTFAHDQACVYGPNSLPGATMGNGVGPNGNGSGGFATDFPSNAIVSHVYNDATTGCQVTQNGDGALDFTRDLIRFGLMTFDQDPGAGIGVTPSSASPTVINPAFDGMWSYFPNWNSGGICPFLGNPAGCLNTPQPFAVGARNPAAPPWEGRMIMLPPPPPSGTTALQQMEQNNDQIQSVINSVRPYGATPIAGMFTDAQYYFWNDPSGPQKVDPYVNQGGCRSQYILLLTDGAPNLDMRGPTQPGGGGCDDTMKSPAGTCPFSRPEDIAFNLAHPTSTTNSPVYTFVLGFAVSNVTDPTNPSSSIACSQLDPNGTQCLAAKAGTLSTDAGLQDQWAACCELQRIAVAGAPPSPPGPSPAKAFFAQTPGDLQNALNAILASILTSNTTRTTPVFATAAGSAVSATDPYATKTNEAQFNASFLPEIGLPWAGDIQRSRYECTFGVKTVGTASVGVANQFTVQAQTVDPNKGDDFASNLNHAPNSGTTGQGPPRTFIAILPTPTGGGTPDSSTTIRPYYNSTGGDGLPIYTAKMFAGDAVNDVIPKITPEALAVQGGYLYNSNINASTPTMSPQQARNMLLAYTFGLQSVPTDSPLDFTFLSRFNGGQPSPPKPSVFGDIFHANPTVVGPPSALLQDPGYVGFRGAYDVAHGLIPARKTIIYAATNDGLLHAFWADVPDLENNEIWAFMPPAVMPNIASTYPASDQFLLDGSPVAKDTVWDRGPSNAADATAWHTTLVAGFGAYGPYQHRGYYAVDVTNPVTTGFTTIMTGCSTACETTGTAPPGPVFLWQLTTVPSTNYQIFGRHSATPAITTLFVDPGDGGGARDIGVAILPGGQDSDPTSTTRSCARVSSAFSYGDALPAAQSFPARAAVRCWGQQGTSLPDKSDPVVGRSLSVVRLDTGEILRVFARANTAGTGYNDFKTGDKLLVSGRTTDTPLDSPMTGTPVPYPSDIGSDATRVYVGDADGTVWRFDLSNSNPASWFGEMYMDLYNTTVDTNKDTSGNSTAWEDGQPIQVPMTLAIDPQARVVLDVAPGDTTAYDTSGQYYVYSLTETVQGTTAPKQRAYVNWYMGSSPPPPAAPNGVMPGVGERVSGPMTVFNSNLYFATYAAAQNNTQACLNAGAHARLWGLDFTQPADPTSPWTVNADCVPHPSTCDRSHGGKVTLTKSPDRFYQPDQQAVYAGTAGAVIPGVSIKATPACLSLGASGSDQYVGGVTHSSVTNFTPGSYSLSGTAGGLGTKGMTNIDVPIPTPSAPTTIDSWASVIE